MNGGKYTEIQSDNNTIDKQIQSVEGSVMEGNEIIERNDADTSLREREMCSESLRSEVRESAKISRYNNDKKLTWQNIHLLNTNLEKLYCVKLTLLAREENNVEN